MKTVSIIIPVYNTAEFIEKCINSVLKQSYKNIEIIVINDNSSDDSLNIIMDMLRKDKRIILYNFEERKGVGAARNYGIRKAKGDYLFFLDSDDYLPPDTIDLLVSKIGRNDIIRGRLKTTYLSSSFALLFDGLYKPKNFSENRFNLIRNNSAVNFLFSKQFILNNKLSFSEEIEIYSDLYFLIPALLAVENIPYLNEAIYFKRKRNDPVSNPSLSQSAPEYKIDSFINAYINLKQIYREINLANDFLDKHFLNFYRKEIITYFYDNKNINRLYEPLTKAIKMIDTYNYEKYDWFLKREIKSILNKGKRKYKKINTFHHFLRDFKEAFKSKRKFLIFLYKRVFTKLPLKKNLIFFESFLGKNYSDSPKYIYEYMVNEGLKYKFVWSFNEKTNIPGKQIQVKRFSLPYFYYLARAKYWVSNSRLPKYLNKREGNIYLQTWHGTPLKKLVFDMDDVYSADPNYKQNFYYQSRRWDYLSSPNEYSSKIFRRAFKYKKTMLEFGYPRNDILYNKNDKKNIEQLKKSINIPTDKKVILYAPTWRDDDYFARGKYNFELQLNLDHMRSVLGDDYIILLRMHYFIANQIDLSSYQGFAYDLSNYDDIAELYLVSDVLITDYSSVFFDYANLKRPILFYTYDLEKYRNKLRGFYLDIENDLPGPLVKNTNEVIESLQNIENVQRNYKEKYQEFYNKFCNWDDGNASRNTVEKVFESK